MESKRGHRQHGLDRSPTEAAVVRIYGRVQGVGFRAALRRKAVSLGVAGEVRNVPDGSVEAILEGDSAALQALVEWCWVGPPLAAVTDVIVAPRAPLGINGFRISG